MTERSLSPGSLTVSGERFTIIYPPTGKAAEAKTKAEDIWIEQTVEFPAELIRNEEIRQHIFGRIKF